MAKYLEFSNPIKIPFSNPKDLKWHENYYWMEPEYGMMLSVPKQWEFKNRNHYPYGLEDAAWRGGLALIAYPELHDQLYPFVLTSQEERLRYIGPVLKRTRGFDKPVHPYYGWSRDQRIMGMASLFITGHQKDIHNLVSSGAAFDQPCNPKYSMRPALKHWLRYLDSGDMKDARKFHKWVKFEYSNFRPVAYALHLTSWMMYCCPNEEISNLLIREYIPNWNLLLMILNNEVVQEMEVASWIPLKGYQWQNYDEPDPVNDAIDVQNPYKLDKAILWEMYLREFDEFYKPKYSR